MPEAPLQRWDQVHGKLMKQKPVNSLRLQALNQHKPITYLLVLDTRLLAGTRRPACRGPAPWKNLLAGTRRLACQGPPRTRRPGRTCLPGPGATFSKSTRAGRATSRELSPCASPALLQGWHGKLATKTLSRCWCCRPRAAWFLKTGTV